ncbi:hypothetical protein Rs2_17283 [Raphanus sativus]|uniref:Uncharacterized protein LOC108850891 n=1 Tax=Raphanus sativus TaxID=3726 RepID=A0A9W3DK39_RAPSA|nr:uncharacterized protein LOC108850891 [Raphanus sativus]KAJ4903332.1 hypothetical protein Rs2_17283 [Raphanus sativus]
MKGLELNDGSDAEIRKSSIRRISVEGYDISLRIEDVDEALRKHFASCGKIIHVYIPGNNEWTILCKYAFVYFNEEDEEKALRLDGRDMGGQILQIKSYPFHETYLNDVVDPMKDDNFIMYPFRVEVAGYDNSLPLDVVKKEIKEYFSVNRSFAHHHKTSSAATEINSFIYLKGQEAVDKALERSGSSVGGLSLVVTKVFPIEYNPPPTGYIPPRIYNTFTQEQKDDPNLYYTIIGRQQKKSEQKKSETKKKKKTKTREGNQKKKKTKTTEGNQKKSETTEGNQKKKSKTKGVQISF